ncbi:hypothetical protein DL770_006905 [Monosporascus sp. CRB-9-2]|nr:hypothetical protein DL770_006905 [Monosporascus sp. CRB-9-2]
MVTPTQTDMPPPSHPSQPPGSRTASVKNESINSPQAELSDEEGSASQVQDAESLSERAPSLSSTQPTGGTAESSGAAPVVPLQKRRRVTRMCLIPLRSFPAGLVPSGKEAYADMARTYNRPVTKCTYDKPSNRRRNPAPQYIEALENKLSRAETLLRKFMPDVDLNDPNLDPSVQQEFRMREKARLQAAALKGQQPGSSSSSARDSQLRSMIDSVGQLELNEKGDYDFHGTSSGSVFFKRMKDHFRAFLGRDHQLPSISKSPRPSGVVTLDSPKSSASSPWSASNPPHLHQLPPKSTALALCSESLSNATCLLRIVHQPSFFEMLNGLYEKSPGGFEAEDNRNLALAYSVMALGCMYNVQDRKLPGTLPYQVAIDQGLQYYNAARALLQDITECRDLTSLQALLFMILFIQSISNLSTCYGFVGIALRSALRMGLHRHFPQTQINPIESESRRRVFYVCRQIDTYVSALLGFPLLLNEEDIDQPLPTPVDDQFITAGGIISPPPGTPSFFEAFNAHAKLMSILGKTVKSIYPLKRIEQKAAEGPGKEQANASYSISYAKVKELEEELQQWNEELPLTWRPNPEGPDEIVRVRNLLRFTFAHVQMVLYRPFLHYVSPRVSAGKSIDERGYACGAAGITVARNIVHIGLEMRKQVSLVGPYWFTFFTEFFAILTLVFFVLENQDKDGSKEILADAIAGKEMISGLARTCLAADKISSALNTIFEQLPDSLKRVKARSSSSKKRPAPSSRAASVLSASSHSHFQVESSRTQSQESGLTESGTSSVASTQPTISFDDTPLQPQDCGDSFSSGFQFSPLDMSTPSSDSAATAGFQDATHFLQQQTTGTVNPIHRLDAMMFPSGDPLAYPNQPRVDFGDQRPGPPSASPGMPSHDPSQFYMPNLYDNIEGQLLGPLPPYMMNTQTHPGFDFPAAMYTDPTLPMQQIPQIPPLLPPQLPIQGQPQFQHQSVRRIIHPHRLQMAQPIRQRRPPRQPEDLLANTPWHGMFPQHGID